MKNSKKKTAFAKYLRRNMTMPEVILWAKLKNNQLGVRINSQKVLYGYIADFYCEDAKLVIEVDGPCHDSQKLYDRTRDQHLKEKGIDTVRFTAQEVNNNTNAVVALIKQAIFKRK